MLEFFRIKRLIKKAMCIFLRIAGFDKPVAFYNPDMILAVGYRTKLKKHGIIFYMS